MEVRVGAGEEFSSDKHGFEIQRKGYNIQEIFNRN